MKGNRIWLVMLLFTAQHAPAQDMCQIQGPSGTCGIATFFGAEAAKDKSGYSCEKFRGARYFHGQCVDGKLDGVVGLTQAADSRWGRSSRQFLLQTSNGVPQNAGLAYSNVTLSVLSFANGVEESSAGCINWHAGWDHRKSYAPCIQAADLFGASVFDQPFIKLMVAGKADLSELKLNTGKIGANTPATQDDPKARGRSARVM